MARPSKLSDKQWAEIEDVASQLNTMSDNEQSAILQLRIAILAGDLERWLGVNKIERHRFEFNVSAGRIDLLLFHSDGGASIVEVKGDCDMRSISGGIGQLCLYEHLLRLSDKLSPKYINKILCAPVEKPEKGAHLIGACNIAGVKFVHLAPHKVFKARIDKLKR